MTTRRLVRKAARSRPEIGTALRAAIYVRVSKEDQLLKYGLDAQLSELRRLAQTRGYVVHCELVDGGLTGDYRESTIDQLPGLEKLRELARDGVIQVVLITELDRLGRPDDGSLLTMVDAMMRAEVIVETLSGRLEDTPEGRLHLSVLAGVAAFEKHGIRKRTTRGRRERLGKGLWPGGRLWFGYQPDPQHPGQIIVHPANADRVREMFRWYVGGQSIRAIAKELHRRGDTAAEGGRWNISAVDKLLKQTAYTGLAYYGRTYPKTHRLAGEDRPEQEWLAVPGIPRIISDELWQRAQEQRARNAKVLQGRPGVRRYLLRGLLVCHTCRTEKGEPRNYATTAKRVGSKDYRFYRCPSKDHVRTGVAACGSPTLNADAIETKVWTTIEAALRNPELLATWSEQTRTKLGVRDIEVRSEVEHLAKELADLKRREQRLLDAYETDDDAPAEALRERLGGIKAKRAGLQERLTKAQQRAADARAAQGRQEALEERCKTLRVGLNKLKPEGRQELLREIIVAILVGPGGELEIRGEIDLAPTLATAPETVHFITRL
jgi:site-specific DNA recombinase